MKMIYAGLTGFDEDLLYNCTRNPSCQPEFFIPVGNLNKLFLFCDLTLPGKPLSYEITILGCNEPINPVFCNYVIGQRADNTWYAVFTGLVTSDLPALDVFYFYITFTTLTGTYGYYTNQIRLNDCPELLFVESCYNDTSPYAIPTDCNGIYYGYHAGTDEATGNNQLRYYHNVWLRYGELVETKNKFQFNAFDNRNTYRNYFTRIYTLQCELIPRFFKDILIGVLNRGNIGIDGNTYRLSDQQDISQTDENTKMWRIVISCENLCKQFFSCTPTVCAPAPLACTGNYTTATIDEDYTGFTLSDGFVTGDDYIVWHLYEDDVQVDNGASPYTHIDFSIVPDVENHCYRLEWKKICDNDCSTGQTSFNNKTFGFCEQCCTPSIESAESNVSGSDNVITINFTPCSPALNGFDAYYRPIGNTGAYRSGGNFTASPIVITDSADAPGTEYEGYIKSDCGEGRFGPDVTFITAGYGCGDFITDSYGPNNFHSYPYYYFKSFAGGTVVTLNWQSFDRPNRFTVYDITTGSLIISTGWKGNAPYAGPWGGSLSTLETGALPFTSVAGHTYRLLVEAGPGNPSAPESDSFYIDISC